MRTYSLNLLAAIVIPLLLTCSSCNLDRDFCTTASYEAVNTGFLIKIIGAGTVPFGHDLSNDYMAVAIVCPLAKSSGKPIRLKRTGLSLARYEIIGGDSGPLAWTFRDKGSVLERVFRSAGFDINWSAEIAETMHVFGNISSGPKATIMPGQTKFLKVKAVKFRRAECTDQTPIKWIERSALALNCSSSTSGS